MEKRKGRERGKNSTKPSEASNDGKKKEKSAGHFANKRPKKKKQSEQESDAEDSGSEERHGNVTWDASTFLTHHNVVNIATKSKFKRTEVLLNNQADVSVLHPDLLQDLKKTVFTMVCTKAEEARAKRAYELLRTSGFPLYNEAVHLVADGIIRGNRDSPQMT
jgi:hypothetical protein